MTTFMVYERPPTRRKLTHAACGVAGVNSIPSLSIRTAEAAREVEDTRNRAVLLVACVLHDRLRIATVMQIVIRCSPINHTERALVWTFCSLDIFWCTC